MRAAFKFKNLSTEAILKRCKILYDRYHNMINNSAKDFWFMSCKTNEIKNILTLFQNNKQTYCNIENIYDCNFHPNIDHNFDNPSCYDEIKYLKSYKSLLEFSIFNIFNQQTENFNIKVSKKENESNNISEINTDNYSVNKESEDTVSELTIENKNGTTKLIHLNNNNLISNNESQFKDYLTDLVIDFNHLLKNIKCYSSIIPQIKLIKQNEINNKKPCSDLCYKNFLICDKNLINTHCKNSLTKKFPLVYEILFIKFLQIVKYDPCHLFKLIKIFSKSTVDNFKIDCYDIYFHMLNQKFKISKIIKKELFDLNLKERELSRKTRMGLSLIQTKRIEQNNLKKKFFSYIPCTHFGNETCDDFCPCAIRGFCEKFCKCNKILCKYIFHGCHCSKGDCSSNHCPCFTNNRECDPDKCKNCFQNCNRCKNMQLSKQIKSKLKVGNSGISGWGLFADENIQKDFLIGEYIGELINFDTVNKRDKYKDYEGSTYMFTLDDDYTVDSRRMGNLLRYANHSKVNANAYPRVIFCAGHRRIGLFAKRNIMKGEEILFDYDGQGYLGKQFEWINNEKYSLNQKCDNEEKNNDLIKEESCNKNENENIITKNKDGTNIFDKMLCAQDIENKNDSFLNKKREIDSNITEEQNKNEDITNKINSSLFNKNSKKFISNKEKNKRKIQNKELCDENEKSLKNPLVKPIFAGDIEKQNLLVNNSNSIIKSKDKINGHKIEYNYISIEDLNLFIYNSTKNKPMSEKKESNGIKETNITNKKINNKQLFKTNVKENTNNKTNKKNDSEEIITSNKKTYTIANISLIIKFEEKIDAEFAFISPIESNILKNYKELHIVTKDINSQVEIEENDVYGYLLNKSSNTGHVLLAVYLTFSNKLYYCRIEDQNLDLFILSKGKLFELIEEKCGLTHSSRNYRLLFLLKKSK